ncbi:sporulation histidine kinase inhibitor Sda [Bacillus sp. z60-18]|uniref:sporulation histidine kinase inhibitor Sda n=1 Tax=unclassified Bacillus (in: firmicutes) TaxID=185979 RepID=UPI00390CB60D
MFAVYSLRKEHKKAIIMKTLADKDLVNAYRSAKKLSDADPHFLTLLENELRRRSISIDSIKEPEKRAIANQKKYPR